MVSLRMERFGIAVLKEAGAAKVRLPRGSHEAILINTSGGLAGGDDFKIEAAAGPGARLSLTSQAAERVYRTLGPPAAVHISLTAGPNSQLFWLPQETILFDGSALNRQFAVMLDEDADFLAIEPVVLGRKEMGELPRRLWLREKWRIHCGGRLIHAENLLIDGGIPGTRATLDGATAFATLIHVSKRAGAALDQLREAIGAEGSASTWNGKLVARMVAPDGFHLRKVLFRALNVIPGVSHLPRPWSF